MEKLLISLGIGAAAGLIDIAPMLAKKMNRYATVSAFVHYLVAGVVIVHIDLPWLAWWLKGGLVAAVLSLPVLVLVAEKERGALPVITGMALFLGTLIGIAAKFLI